MQMHGDKKGGGIVFINYAHAILYPQSSIDYTYKTRETLSCEDYIGFLKLQDEPMMEMQIIFTMIELFGIIFEMQNPRQIISRQRLVLSFVSRCKVTHLNFRF